MIILGLETATNVAGAAVLSDEKLLCESQVNHTLKHSKTLMPTLQFLIESIELSFSDVDYFAVSTGPGSFTGLRIGLATVKGLAQATKKPVIPVSTLESLAYNIPYASGVICPVLDARREQVYTALFSGNPATGEITRLSADSARDYGQLTEILRHVKGTIHLLGDAAVLCKGFLPKELEINLVDPYLRAQSPASLCACAANHLDSALDFHLLSPSYLRPSYAEEKKK